MYKAYLTMQNNYRNTIFMRKSNILIALLFIAIAFSSCKSKIIMQPEVKHNTNRIAAEWEPAIGTIIAWPLDIPHNLVIELAKDGKLFTMVPNQEQKAEAIEWYTKWNIDLTNIEFIIAPQGLDSWWLRDWGPFAVFNQKGEMQLADGEYELATPVSGPSCNEPLQLLYTKKNEITGETEIIRTLEEDNAPDSIGKHINASMIKLPIPFTGGNIFTDGRGNGISTCIILNENKFIGNTDSVFFAETKTKLGINNYTIISNFEESGIQHIDCYLKMLDEDRLFVMLPPADHAAFNEYNRIANEELSKMTNAYGRPYEILRLNTYRYDGEELAAYSNSLIINKTIYMPMFGIPEDSLALAQWEAAMPGYTVKGFIYDVYTEPKLDVRVISRRASGHGWNGGDALHCRTRAMWDKEMLYISVNRFAKEISIDTENKLEVNIIDYSNKGLYADKLFVNYREKGSDKWNKIALEQSEKDFYFVANLPKLEAGKTFEYYVSAASASGKTETMPRTAPVGLYTFTTK